ncbi:putative NIMA-like protein kinase [Venustampulla echinocandica]|uniref:non-specific serine/threonine protein kinase n=1 Tax=Venustampulla echinocandica TaxID=2656787 RepID=A0A370TZX2_9HELO|nr:putative NIMA-like protein kinase [Venustampulla echinocandica]RDL41065.1 putative NIMA-like protein kinase [Venustampulla echinocandica]
MSEGDKYDILEKIGHGSFGIIRKVRRKQDGQVLCRKEINYLRMSQKEREQLHAEFAILSSLRHPNIVGYYHREHLKSTQDLHLYMEYCGNGDLGRVIKDLQAKKQYAEEGFVWSMFSQLVTALYRCHYGVDPPEVGSNVMGLGNSAKPRQPAGNVMILHRDLKPENVFLGEDNSVKLGDFGLSKIMQSHDFASTYVGTPFYMSPEICAAERYTLKSDIWSLGCIIYELCAREPPFNAKSHFQLVQKIKEGKVAPLPQVYSPELNAVIKDCLKVNPDRRPDTVTLLNLPVVKLMRKEKEVVELGRMLRNKEEVASRRLNEAEERLRKSESEKTAMRLEIEASLRREWEVKAQLEINRLVQQEIEKLQKKFDYEVQERVDSELQKRSSTESAKATSIKDFSGSNSHPQNDIQFSSVGTSGDGDFPSSTDLTDLSLDSPEPSKGLKKSTRTPFGRAQTMFAGTPMDIEMGEPSPISIASLSLSPRRNGAAKAPNGGRNIFAAAAGAEARWQPSLINSDDSDDDDVPPHPSPTRQKSAKNPFKPSGARPALISQRTVPAHKPSQLNIFNAAKVNSTPTLPSLSSAPDLRPQASSAALKERSSSPNRRLSKIPSSTNLHSHDNRPTSPTRKSSLTKGKNTGGDDLNKIATKNNMIKAGSGGNLAPKGRTLVELAQARAGGRPVDEGNRSPEPKGRAFAARMTDKVAARDQEIPVWDPERDEMPSPFLVRTRAPVRRL